MENISAPPPSAPPAAVPEYGSAPPVAMPAPAPVMAQPAPAPSNGMSNFFDGITFTDVAIIGLVSLALFYSIYYHREMIKMSKAWKTAEQRDIEELKSNVQAIMGPDYRKF